MIQFNFCFSSIWKLDVVQTKKVIEQATEVFNVLNYRHQKKLIKSKGCGVDKLL